MCSSGTVNKTDGAVFPGTSGLGQRESRDIGDSPDHAVSSIELNSGAAGGSGVNIGRAKAAAIDIDLPVWIPGTELGAGNLCPTVGSIG